MYVETHEKLVLSRPAGCERMDSCPILFHLIAGARATKCLCFLKYMQAPHPASPRWSVRSHPAARGKQSPPAPWNVYTQPISFHLIACAFTSSNPRQTKSPVPWNVYKQPISFHLIARASSKSRQPSDALVQHQKGFSHAPHLSPGQTQRLHPRESTQKYRNTTWESFRAPRPRRPGAKAQSLRP